MYVPMRLLLCLHLGVQVVYCSHADLEAAQRMERGTRAGSMAQVAGYARGAGCRRKAVLKYFGEQRCVGTHPYIHISYRYAMEAAVQDARHSHTHGKEGGGVQCCCGCCAIGFATQGSMHSVFVQGRLRCSM